MKKSLLLVVVLFVFGIGQAAIFYVSPTGNDANNGSIGSPWKTLKKATTSVTTPGDVIHVTAGTYLETSSCSLAAGVSLEGDGTTVTTIKSTLTADFTAMLMLTSTPGTNGNQFIQNITFEGQYVSEASAGTDWGIIVAGRNNVTIRNCVIQNFYDRGVIFAADVGWATTKPSVYGTNNSFHDNTVTNCAAYNAPSGVYGRGCLNIGGQDGMLVYNNTITQNQRPLGYNGWPIKYHNDGWNRNVKIYNNNINKIPFHGTYPGDGGWNFAIELWETDTGCEIYNNEIVGGAIDIDRTHNNLNGAYSMWIHHNNIYNVVTNPNTEVGIILENYGGSNSDVIVEFNNVWNKAKGIEFSNRNGGSVNNIKINNNLFYGIGRQADGNDGFAILFGSDPPTGGTVNNVYIRNNTFVAYPGKAPWYGIKNNSALPFDNIYIQNNIVQGFMSNGIQMQSGSNVNHIWCQNNNLIGNGNANDPVTPLGTTQVVSGNTKLSPLFVDVSAGNYTLQATSPMIDAGMNVGLPFSGAAPDKGYKESGATGNVPPAAKAGADQTITLPTSSVTLNGSGSDPDGTISTYAWTKVSGPAGGTIATPATASTNITGLIAGTYIYRLTVTDNKGATGTDDVQIIVNSAPNQAPTANAGADQTITLPTSSVTLTGSGTDPDGTISTYAWTKVSGPAGGAIATPAAASTNITGLIAGTYVYRLTVTDNGGATATNDVQIIVNSALNQAPTANAGADQTITLPTSSVTLTGSGTDPDGTISTYAWTKVSGPAGGTIATPATASTNITGLIAGTYVYRLTVTDNGGATATNDVQIIVNSAPNQAPSANAGADQTITLPTSSVTLNGSGTDPDGTISSYAWAKVSGPAGGAIATPATASTNITGLVAGTYVYRLTVTDNGGATATNDVQIIVNNAPAPPPNQAPTANAGADQSLTLPTSNTSVAGSGTDPDGTISTYAWTKVSGPAGGTIGSPAAASTSITGLATAGVYVFRLTVTDNGGATAFDDIQITVNSAPNQAPSANAGVDMTITLPTNSVTLNGSGTDPDGTISTYTWTKVSGPAGGTIASPNTQSTNITGLWAGTYVYRCTVTDNKGATGTDDVQITVNNAPNQAPTANAGANQTITLPTSSVTLNGSGTDPDGTISAYAWTKVSGPAGGTIASPAAASTNITGLVAGSYTYRLTVTDNSGATAFDDIQITVNSAPAPPPNLAPTANAGANQAITLPTSSVTLTGSGTDPDGTISAYAWTKVSGPAGGTIASPAAASTNITGLVAGSYTYRLTVTDNSGATAFDDVQITVNSAPTPNQAPTANAGANQTITLPTSSVTLNGSGTDPDGTISSYSWTKVSGPAGGTIATPATASTNITGLVAGSYTYRLTVTDNNGATAFDDVQITVNNVPAPPANQAPTANAGANQTITLPTSSVTLNGSGTDPDGTISTYAWTKVSGPVGGTVASPAAASTNITGLVAGSYVYRLTVTDNSGATAFDDVQITVNNAPAPPPNQVPTANAGANQTITLPTSSVTLNGSGTDPDGTISAFAWTKVSGPAGGTIASPAAASTNITGLVAGSYTYRLTVTDNSGATAYDDVQVTVNSQQAPIPPPNQAPTANAGADFGVELPTTSATLNGTGTDPDGTITAYLWTKVSGPTGGNISSTSSASTSITGLLVGIYVYRLRVTDNSGATATDDITVSVTDPSRLPPSTDLAPVAIAEKDAKINLPDVSKVDLNGNKSYDPDGSIVKWAWKLAQGPAGSTIANSTSPSASITVSRKGTYLLELAVTDNAGMSSKDSVTIVVTKTNRTPRAMTTYDTSSVSLPARNTLLEGSTSFDPDGSITTYKWTYLNGPATYKILHPDSANTVVANLSPGTYQFGLEVMDDDSAIDKKTVTVLVKKNLSRTEILDVKLYPNPAVNNVYITVNAAVQGRSTITLLDVKGTPVYNEVFDKSSFTVTRNINISGLTKGTYFVVIKVDNSENMIKKLIVL